MPAYSFVPGGPWPHPHRASSEPSSGPVSPLHVPADADPALVGKLLQRGVSLFNAGYYWEAHEVWESLWHFHGRRGAAAETLKGLIKLAAAGVKVREGQEHGVRTHARRAAESFRKALDLGGPYSLGFRLLELEAIAEVLSDDPPQCSASRFEAVVRVFPIELEIREPEC
jgi:hypothetical protein